MWLGDYRQWRRLEGTEYGFHFHPCEGANVTLATEFVVDDVIKFREVEY